MKRLPLMVIKKVDELPKGVVITVSFDGREYSRTINTTQTWLVLHHYNEHYKAFVEVTDAKAIKRLNTAFTSAVFYGRAG